MATFSSTNSEDAAGEQAEQQVAAHDQITPEAITGHSQAVAGPPHSAASNLPAALEPELRRIIDTAVARVAAIELDAIREARELTQRSEVEAREALRFALDRAFNLINSLELLATTVNGMAEALRTELDDAITALRNVPEPESELARELAQQPAAQAEPIEPPQPPAPEPVADAAEPQPTPEPVADAPASEPAPVPEAPEPERAPEPEPVVQAPEPESAPAAQPVGEAATPEPPPVAETPQQPQEAAQEAAPEPRVKLAGLVRAPDGGAAQPEPAADAEPERELVTVGAPAPEPPPARKGRVRRFFTR